MNIWAKMMTALRGGVNEAGEAVVDSQALRILDQEVRDASHALQDSKNSLAEIMARQKVAEEKCTGLKKKIEEHEVYAIKALEKDDETLAHEVAQKIADFENQLIQETGAAEGFKAPGVVVNYTTDADMQNGKKFAALGLQAAAGVPLQCDEGDDYKTFRLGLFGLDKLHNIDRTVANLESVLDQIL